MAPEKNDAKIIDVQMSIAEMNSGQMIDNYRQNENDHWQWDMTQR